MAQQEATYLSLTDILIFVKRRYKIIFYSGLFVALLATLIAFMMQPVYKSETSLLIDGRQSNILDKAD